MRKISMEVEPVGEKTLNAARELHAASSSRGEALGGKTYDTLLCALSKDKYDTDNKKAEKCDRWVRKHLKNSNHLPIGQGRCVLSPDDARAAAFFALIAKQFGFENPSNRVSLIVVNHVVPTLPFFLRGLQYVATVAGVIPKNSESDPNTSKIIREKFKVLEVTREQLKIFGTATSLIKPIVEDGKKCILLDVGGYFAPCLAELATCPSIRDGIVGIIEDTENGHQKYAQVQMMSPWPVVSVARCELKKSEDFNVGKAIVRATDTILRTDAHTLTERMRIGVIGFGKIGQSIAFHLQRNYSAIMIYDCDPVAQLHAASVGFRVESKDLILRNTDLLFCATGNRSLTGTDFEKVKDGLFVASCTSADDEFDLSSLTERQNLHTSNIRVMASLSGARLNLIAGGNAVNFIFNGVNGPYIYAVQAGIIAGCAGLLMTERFQRGTLNSLPLDYQRRIANVWLQLFEGRER